MIDITQYRCHIGLFRQRIIRNKFLFKQRYCRKFSRNNNYWKKNAILAAKSIFKIICLSMLFIPQLSPVLPVPPPMYASCPVTATRCTLSGGALSWSLPGRTTAGRNLWDWSEGEGIGVIPYADYETGNFWAKYVNGNIRGVKGIHNMHLNIRSLKYKVSEVKNIIYSERPTIFGLSECELRKDNIDPNALKIPGYNILYPKSWDSHGFARTIVYVKKTFQYQQLPDLEDSVVQSVWLKGAFKNCKPVYFCHVYREHNSVLGATINNQKEYLSRLLLQWEAAVDHNSAAEPNEVHISGDMNLDYLPTKWLKPSYRLYSLTKLVQNTCNAHNFSQLVNEPTRTMYNSVSKSTEMSCIDHTYCNYKHRVSPPRVVVCGASDHDAVSYIRYSKGPPMPARTIRRRSYKHFDKEAFVADLSAIDWSSVLATSDLDIAVDIFTYNMNFILNQHAPWIVFQLRKNYSPWLTDEIKEIMKLRDSWKLKAKQLAAIDSGEEASEEQVLAWGEYKKLRNKINNMIGMEELKFKRKKVEENVGDTAEIWRLTKGFMNWKSTGIPTQLEDNGNLITSARTIAQVMNQFFIDKIKVIRQNMATVVFNMAPCMQIMKDKRCKLSLSHVGVAKVEKLLRSLPSSRSTGIDGLDSYSVKVAASIIAAPLHHIITLSIMQHRFPSQWKGAKVLPLHKKLDTLNKKNYRPVAILSPLSKVLEKIVYLQLYSYFTDNKILHPSLHGYRANRSTQTALLQMYDHWVQAASRGQISGAILLDLSAAFDLVPSDILIEKLKQYGLDDGCLSWVRCYMTDRWQAVWIDHVMSDMLNCEVGVPQGSILGPLLFMLYVNDLPSILSCNIDMYADDSTLHTTDKTTSEIDSVLETNCEVVSNWMAENMLKLNAEKTHILTLGTRERLALPGNKVRVHMDGILLEEDPSHRETLLGVVIDSNLKWHGQVAALIVKLKSRLAGLAHIKHVLPYHLRKSVSEGLFSSVLCYCLPLFGGCDAGELHDLQILQNKAAQLVTLSPPRAARHPMYDRLGWLTVNQLVHYHTLLAVYRIRQCGEPEYLAQSLSNDNINGHIIVKNTRLTLLQKSFKFRGACNWNDLPPSLRNTQRIGQFKHMVKAWITENIPRFFD